jgi:hypothetical protein
VNLDFPPEAGFGRSRQRPASEAITPEELLQGDEWAWHDLPSACCGEPLRLPPGAMTVWSWNGKRAEWGTNTQTELAAGLPGMGEADRMRVRIDSPDVWLCWVPNAIAAENILRARS